MCDTTSVTPGECWCGGAQQFNRFTMCSKVGVHTCYYLDGPSLPPPFRREEALLRAIQTLFTAGSHWVHVLNEPCYFLELFVW